MYEQFYNFSDRPFQLTPDARFWFESATHRKAMSYLGYGLSQGEGFIVITGEVGAGKTTLVAHLMATVDPERLRAVKLVSTQLEGDDLLRLVCKQFGLAADGLSKADMLSAIEGHLRDQARAGRRTLLIVDEAQNLALSALEELRMLSNFHLGTQSLLQIFLLGQPEFRETLFRSASLEQLRQRVIATHHLDPMDAEEVEPYLTHRLRKVGWADHPRITEHAYTEMYEYSEGVPRRLNVLANRVLLYGAIERLNVIDGTDVRAVIADIANELRSVRDELPAPTPMGQPVAASPLAVRGSAVVAPAPVPEPEPELEPVAEEAFASLTALRGRGLAPVVLADETDEETEENVEAEALLAPFQPVAAPAPFAPKAVPIAPPPLAGPAFAPPLGEAPAGEDVLELPPAMRMALGALGRGPEPEPAPIAAPFAAAVAAPVEPVGPDGGAEIAALRADLAAMEARLETQDAALRRVLQLLVEWAERDPVGAPGRPTLAA